MNVSRKNDYYDDRLGEQICIKNLEKFHRLTAETKFHFNHSKLNKINLFLQI